MASDKGNRKKTKKSYFFETLTDYTELGAILLEKIYEVKKAIGNEEEEEILDQLDPAEVGGILQDLMPRENIIYLMGTEFGQGCLAGIFLEHLTQMQHEIEMELAEEE